MNLARLKFGMSMAMAVSCGTLIMQEARSLEIQVPIETASFRQSESPGYILALQRCMICHSAQYVSTQPPASSRPYWDATVHKMRSTFGAPIEDDEIPIIVEYLVQAYGAKR